MKKLETPITDLKKNITSEIKVLREIRIAQMSLKNAKGTDKVELESHIKTLKLFLGKTREDVITALEGTKSIPPLIHVTEEEIESGPGVSLREIKRENKEEEEYIKREFSTIEKQTIKRLKKKEEIQLTKKEKKPSGYVKSASKTFAKTARRLIARGYFKSLERDLIRANMEFVLTSYVSMMFYSIMWSIFIGAAITLFFLFFSISPQLPIIMRAGEDIMSRLPKVIWIFLVVPIGTYAAMYFYPALERKSEEVKINHELPFATIHMAAISGSMIDPTKIFKIIVETHEYPSITKEFTKLLNQINVYGYDLVGGLRNSAFNSPSRKLADLYNSLAIAITSGGNLPDFFDKRANSMLFEHRLEKEKEAKAAETFMDIYISVVIAAPMVLMLLLMMLKIGGLGLSLSTNTITISMILGVVVINIFFLAFLHLKHSGE